MLKTGPQLLEYLVEGLIYISIADGKFHPEEDKFISKVATIFKIPNYKLAVIKARYVNDLKASPYLILGVASNEKVRKIKKQWQMLVHENHPDNLIAKGLPKEAITLATKKLIAINAAWIQIKNQEKYSKIE